MPAEDWRRRYPLFPRLLFVLDGTGPVGVDNRVNALRSGSELTGADFLAALPILVAPLTDILRDGPSAPIWRPVTTPTEQVTWTHQR
ncbi:hypothetical protein ABZ835_47205 [Streptomyces sp. NPDC047461]|uniref:hypothetical protein n=1 Tax=Streptomyces sp. NPDC047461 TaxID=3155619 RepID=UPI0033E86E3F